MIGFTLFRGDGLLLHRSAPQPISTTPTAADGAFAAEARVASLPLLAGDYQIVPYVVAQDRKGAPISATEFGCAFSVWNDRDDQGLLAVEYTWLEPANIAVPTIPASL